jgi:thymidylate synthase
LEYHGAYGYRLRKNFGFDQLKKAFLALRNNPDSRQVVMQVWDPKRDFPTDLGEPIAADIPCNLLSMLKVREGMLEWTQVMRSNDAWRGLPYNLVQFTTLHELMAGWLGLLPGSFSVFSDSLHVYENDLPLMKHIHQQSRHLNTDSLALPIDECEVVVSKMEAALEKMLEGQHPEHVLDTLQPVIPQAYLNLFTVVAAEWARRQGLVASASDIMKNSCRNVLLQILWDRWAERFASPLSST